MTTRHTEHEFTSLARNRFEKSVRELDGDTLADLAAIRARALARRPLSSRRWLLIPAGALVSIGLALLVHHTLLAPVPQRSPVHDDIELMSTQEGLELYDDIEFYEWLVDHELPT